MIKDGIFIGNFANMINGVHVIIPQRIVIFFLSSLLFLLPKSYSYKSYNLNHYKNKYRQLSLYSLEGEQNDINDAFVSNDVHSWRIISGPKDVVNHTIHSEELKSDQFANIFQQCAPYIATHRGSKVVVHIPSHVFLDREVFDAVMDDISILHLLGVQLVLIAGVRLQLDSCEIDQGFIPEYSKGVRITDENALNCLKEASGSARSLVESALARGFRGRPGQSVINVVSGNFFYSAKPLGVRDGIDYKFSGEVRRIEVDNFVKRLEQGDVVLLTSLGYSSSGEVFNVPSESLAAECAAKLGASKIIFLTYGKVMIDDGDVDSGNGSSGGGSGGNHILSLRLAQAIALLDRFGITNSSYNEVEVDEGYIPSTHSPTPPTTTTTTITLTSDSNISSNTASVTSEQSSTIELSEGCGSQLSQTTDPEYTETMQFIRVMARCAYALQGGVRRAHLVPPTRGALLKELYTRDGAGILIAKDIYEGIRKAVASDIRAIQEIIDPLVKEGILVPRSRDQLEKDLPNCYVVTRDGTVVALGMLKSYGSGFAEVSCVAVHPKYRRKGRGEILLGYLERKSLAMGITSVFVLSTRTMQWFEERGFLPSDPALLPSTRQYDKTRGSKVYIKRLGTQRDVDADEMFWNV